MLWLIGQIAIFLLIAAFIGFVIGWLLRTMWPSGRARTREGELEAALERAGSRISDLESGLRSKRVAANAAAEQEEAALRRVEELEAALATLHSQSDADTGEVAKLQDELEGAVGSIEALRMEMDDLRTETVVHPASDNDPERPIDQDPGPEPAATQGGLFLVQDEEPESDTVLDEDNPPETAQEIEAKRLIAVAEVAERFRLPDDTIPDDLKRIHGIGPVLENTLHTMNISTFRQIADFTEDDVALVSDALGRAFPDRITRDDWMSSARSLISEDQGDDS